AVFFFCFFYLNSCLFHVFYLFLCFFFCVSVTFLYFDCVLIALIYFYVQIIIREFVSTFFDNTFHLLPFSCYLIPIHTQFSLYFFDRLQQRYSRRLGLPIQNARYFSGEITVGAGG